MAASAFSDRDAVAPHYRLQRFHFTFVDAHRGQYEVEPIGALLPIAFSTYYEHKARGRIRSVCQRAQSVHIRC